MNIPFFSFSILLIIVGVGLIIYQYKDGSYKKGERVTENDVNLTYGGIMAIIVGIILILKSLK